MAGRAIATGARTGVKAGRFGYREVVKPIAKTAIEAPEKGLRAMGRLSRANKGDVSQQELLEHQERMARIRAGREKEPVTREVIRERVVDIPSKPFGGTSSPLVSKPMKKQLRRTKWRKRKAVGK